MDVDQVVVINSVASSAYPVRTCRPDPGQSESWITVSKNSDTSVTDWLLYNKLKDPENRLVTFLCLHIFSAVIQSSFMNMWKRLKQEKPYLVLTGSFYLELLMKVRRFHRHFPSLFHSVYPRELQQ